MRRTSSGGSRGVDSQTSQPGGAIGGFMPLIEAVTQLRGEAGDRQVKGARIAASCGFGGIPYGRPGRSCVALVFGNDD